MGRTLAWFFHRHRLRSINPSIVIVSYVGLFLRTLVFAHAIPRYVRAAQVAAHECRSPFGSGEIDGEIVILHFLVSPF